MSSAGDITPRLPAHLYVHVPLCRSKCAYCDFFSLPLADVAEDVSSIAGSLVAQACGWLARDVRPRLARDASTSVEERPPYSGRSSPNWSRSSQRGSRSPRVPRSPSRRTPSRSTPRLAAALAEAGVTRVSLGVQCARRRRARIPRASARCRDGPSRPHTPCATRVSTLSVDLICGIPGRRPRLVDRQPWSGAIATRRRARLGLPAHDRGRHAARRRPSLSARAAEPDHDIAADMMLARRATCWPAAGFARYEVANYALSRSRVAPQHRVLDRRAVPGRRPRRARHARRPRPRAPSASCPLAVTTSPACATRCACDLRTACTPMPRVDVEIAHRRGGRARGRHARPAARARRTDDEARARGRRPARSRRSRRRPRGARRTAAGGTTERGWLLGNEVFWRVWAGSDRPIARPRHPGRCWHSGTRRVPSVGGHRMLNERRRAVLVRTRRRICEQRAAGRLQGARGALPPGLQPCHRALRAGRARGDAASCSSRTSRRGASPPTAATARSSNDVRRAPAPAAWHVRGDRQRPRRYDANSSTSSPT